MCTWAEDQVRASGSQFSILPRVRTECVLQRKYFHYGAERRHVDVVLRAGRRHIRRPAPKQELVKTGLRRSKANVGGFEVLYSAESWCAYHDHIWSREWHVTTPCSKTGAGKKFHRKPGCQHFQREK
jgi:hypothetical protein